MAVVRYRGTWSEARYAKELAVLRKFIDERGMTAVRKPAFARHDPPFTSEPANELHVA